MRLFSSRKIDEYAPRRPSWWTRFAAFSYSKEYLSKQELELERRSEYTGWVILAYIILATLVIPLIGDDPVDLGIVLVLFIAAGLAILLNRTGHVTLAASLLVTVGTVACVAAPLFATRALTLDELPDFDLLVLPALIAISTLPPRISWIVLGSNVIMICAIFFLRAHAHDLTLDLTPPSYPSTLAGIETLLVRPIALNCFGFLVVAGLVQSREKSVDRQYAAMDLAERMIDRADDAWLTAEQATIKQHFNDKLNDAIDRCLAERQKGRLIPITLQFDAPPRSAFEAQIRKDVLNDAKRLNLALQRADGQVNDQRFNATRFASVLYQIAYNVAATVRDGDARRIHPNNMGRTGYDSLDALAQLLFALAVKAEDMKIVSKSVLPPAADLAIYSENAREAALQSFQLTMWGNALIPYAPASPARQSSGGSPTPLPRAMDTSWPGYGQSPEQQQSHPMSVRSPRYTDQQVTDSQINGRGQTRRNLPDLSRPDDSAWPEMVDPWQQP